MLTKTIDVEIKAIGDEGEGRFQAYASTFGVVDSYGDMVVQGAFTETLGDFGPGGADIPLYWRHRMDDPFMLIGKTLAAKEDEHGLWVDCGFLATNAAKQVYALLSAGLATSLGVLPDLLPLPLVDQHRALRHLHIDGRLRLLGETLIESRQNRLLGRIGISHTEPSAETIQEFRVLHGVLLGFTVPRLG